MQCSVEGCGRPVKVKVRRLCGTHYYRFWKYGSTDLPVRGLLCGRCNSVAGLAGDDPVLLRSVAAYLERDPLSSPETLGTLVGEVA